MLNNSLPRGLSAQRGNCPGQGGLPKGRPTWPEVRQGQLGRPHRGGLMSTLGLEGRMGRNDASQETQQELQAEEGHFQGPGESVTSVNATWLTLRVSGELADQAGEVS